MSLAIKAQGMSEAGVLWSIVGMLSFVIIGIVEYGLVPILRQSPSVFESFLKER